MSMVTRVLLATLAMSALQVSSALAERGSGETQDAVTLTGCLRTGSAASVLLLRSAREGEGMPRDYLLVAIPGGTDLSPHMNHLVAVTGRVHAAKDGPEPPAEANTAEKTLRRLALESFREVAASCD